MNCERAVELLTGGVDAATAADRRLAGEHVATCADCRHAVMSVHALRLMSVAPVAAAPRGGFERVLARLGGGTRSNFASRGRFWLGAAAGASIAASLALAIGSILWSPAERSPTATTPRLSVALNETQDVSIALTTAEALSNAEIHLSLTGSIGLAGYGDVRELNWRTDLDAGPNQLTLPIVAIGAAGGQVLVEVVHSGRRRTFLVDVETRAATPEVI